jgi:transcription factor MYB, plant
VWNTHLKKKVKQREQQKAGAATPITSSSASSSTSTANSSGQQGGTSKEPYALDIPPLETDINILGMLLDELPAAAEPMPPPSPCSSSSLTTCVGGGVEDLIELPVIDIEADIWSIIDGADLPDDSGAHHWDAAVPCTGAAVSTGGEAGKASDWWLENLEKELGLWGPEEDSQTQSDILGQMGFAVPIEDTEGDISTYFQSGPATAVLL